MVAAAVVLQQDNAVARPVASLSRAEVLTRYRHFREISKQHHSAVLNFLPKDTVISQARRIGLAQGKTLVLEHGRPEFGLRPFDPHRTEGPVPRD